MSECLCSAVLHRKSFLFQLTRETELKKKRLKKYVNDLDTAHQKLYLAIDYEQSPEIVNLVSFACLDSARKEG